MPFYEKSNVRIRYEEAGRGCPLLLVPGSGLNSRRRPVGLDGPSGDQAISVHGQLHWRMLRDETD